MSRFDSQMPLIPSILDRLIDEEPDVSSEPLWHRSHTLQFLKESVRRDLENLLNTRQSRSDLFLQGGELATSVLTYGIPDFTAMDMQSGDEQDRLKAAVEKAIRMFEPRLIRVQAHVEAPGSKFDRKVHLTINAVLCVEPIIEPIVFDTIVDSSTGVCNVDVEG